MYSHKNALRALLLLAVILTAPRHAPAQQETDEKLNVIVILADDISASEFGCYGGECETPNIDQLASSGIRFVNAFGSPMCVPSRAMLLTGLHPDKTGVFHNSLRPLRRDKDPRANWGQSFDLFPEVFQRNGYRTLITGKWQMAGTYPKLGFDYGFDEYCLHHEWRRPSDWNQPGPKFARYEGLIADKRDLFPGRTSGYWHPSIAINGFLMKTDEKDFGPDIYNDYLLQYIERNQDRPFLVYYPMMLAHSVTDFHSEKRENKDQRFGQMLPNCPKIVNGKPTSEREPDSVEGNLRYVDYLVGRVMKKLKALQMDQRTLIVFASDNATIGKGKGQPQPRGSHIPLIAACPGKIPAGRVSDELVSLVDIHSTVTHFTNVEKNPSSESDGLDLSGYMRGETDSIDRKFAFGFLADESWVRDKKYLLKSSGEFYEVGDVEDNNTKRMREIEISDASSLERNHFEKLTVQLQESPRFKDVNSPVFIRYRDQRKQLQRNYLNTPVENRRKFVKKLSAK